jgi:hypothetical protein
MVHLGSSQIADLHQNRVMRKHMLKQRIRSRGVQIAAAALLCAAVSFGAAPSSELESAEAQQPQANRAFYDGREIEFTPAHTRIPGREYKFGPWSVGARASNHPKPSDHSPNLYLVVPGTQFERTGSESFNHNRILSTIPKGGGEWEWDVYWALVIDPTLTIDFHSERELLVAAQEEFMPPADFSIDKAPAQAVLRDVLKIRTLEQLKKYRRPDGTLPGILIIPANFAVHGTAYDVDNTPPNGEKATANARPQR